MNACFSYDEINAQNAVLFAALAARGDVGMTVAGLHSATPLKAVLTVDVVRQRVYRWRAAGSVAQAGGRVGAWKAVVSVLPPIATAKQRRVVAREAKPTFKTQMTADDRWALAPWLRELVA